MADIAIIGAGTAGLHLALRLLGQGHGVTLYTDRTAEQVRGGRLPNTVAHNGATRARERALGVNHWDAEGLGVRHIDFHVGAPVSLSFSGRVEAPGLFVDYRLYQSRLLEDVVARGGALRVGPIAVPDVERLAAAHELLVVASGRAGLGDALFPRIPELSPHARPARRLFAALVHGIRFERPQRMQFVIAPGHGELFESQVVTERGLVSNLLIEAVPGGALEVLTTRRPDEDPAGFQEVLLGLLREHMPHTYARVDREAFRIAGALDWVQGGFTPVVRRAWAELPGRRTVLALGDAHVLHDPVGGLGANTASAAAFALADVIEAAVRAGRPLDADFCRHAAERLWEAVLAPTVWNNALLEVPPPHLLGLMAAAGQDPALADAVVNTLVDPEKALATFATPDTAAAFHARHRTPERRSA